LSAECGQQLCAVGYSGAACALADDCHSGICDDDSCTPGYRGAVCRSNGDCHSDDCGASSTCDPGAPGTPCTAPGDCLTGLCNAGLSLCEATPLLLLSTTPADGASAVSLSANLTLVFSEDVAAGIGNITIRRASNGSVFETIAVTDPKVTINDETVVVNPAGLFGLLTEYYVLIDAGALQSLAGGQYAGITDATAFSFTTLL
jgi:hypothetical protein